MTNVLHSTTFEFPLDRCFYGQTFVIGAHTKNSKLETAVSYKGNYSCDDELFKLQQKVASQKFNTTLLRKSNETSDPFTDLITQWLNNGDRVALAIHYFPHKFDVLEKTKKEYGKDIQLNMHLHCLADLYLSNLKRPELSKKQQKYRDKMHRFIDKTNPNFIAVSDAVKRSFHQHGLIPEGRIKVVHNGVSDELYVPVSDEKKQEFKKNLGIKASKLVGYSGRLEDAKGYQNLLGILKEYDKKPTDLGFVVATSNKGDVLKQNLKDLYRIAPHLIEEDNLKVVVDVSKLTSGFFNKDQLVGTHFYEYICPKELRDEKVFGDIITLPLQPYLDVYLHPSNSEAISLSVLEAAMSGTPVVASNVGGIPVVINYNNGVLVEIGDIPKREQRALRFSKAIEETLSKERNKDFINKVRENLISAGFDEKTMARKMDDIYTS